jgi:hypothetical protein
LTADSPVQVSHPEMASLRRSRRRLWKISHRPPIPTALLLITAESVPAGTTRSAVEEAESTSALRAPAPTGGLELVCHPWVRAAHCSETGFPEACWVGRSDVAVGFRAVHHGIGDPLGTAAPFVASPLTFRIKIGFVIWGKLSTWRLSGLLRNHCYAWLRRAAHPRGR